MKTKKKSPIKKKAVTKKKKSLKRRTLSKGPLSTISMLSAIVRCLDDVEVMVQKTCAITLAKLGCSVAVLGNNKESHKLAYEQIERNLAAAQIGNAKLDKDLN